MEISWGVDFGIMNLLSQKRNQSMHDELSVMSSVLGETGEVWSYPVESLDCSKISFQKIVGMISI